MLPRLLRLYTVTTTFSCVADTHASELQAPVLPARGSGAIAAKTLKSLWLYSLLQLHCG
jgi:hypothetical protein